MVGQGGNNPGVGVAVLLQVSVVQLKAALSAPFAHPGQFDAQLPHERCAVEPIRDILMSWIVGHVRYPGGVSRVREAPIGEGERPIC